MAALISVFIAITLSLLITRIATEALTLSLSRTSASNKHVNKDDAKKQLAKY